jgi:hypothetical protein
LCRDEYTLTDLIESLYEWHTDSENPDLLGEIIGRADGARQLAYNM